MSLAKAGIPLLLLSTLGSSWAAGAQEAPPGPAHAIQHVFVIAMENHDPKTIIGTRSRASYLNATLVPISAQATHFNDELPLDVPSEPHYLWMEAGTNAFSDHKFLTDGDPSSSNSTKSTDHLVTQIKNAKTGVTWMTYQEGQDLRTGACPVASSRFYAAKHNPFVFFQDVSGSPPSKANGYCAAHSRPLSLLAKDLDSNTVDSYVFITPNLCNDMHGAFGCPLGNPIKLGDDWLRTNLPKLIKWVSNHAGVIFITWDEGERTRTMPFLAIGPGVKVGYSGGVAYNHGSIVKSVEDIFNLPVLASVAKNNDLSDLFKPGFFP
ncbi:MAG TPA: alkaline phosphatase family protein [Thermoanaerobaculia bacterium]|nr:alkaline phosphatase family protein [Thermoanaerobaculia bacterium]